MSCFSISIDETLALFLLGGIHSPEGPFQHYSQTRTDFLLACERPLVSYVFNEMRRKGGPVGLP